METNGSYNKMDDILVRARSRVIRSVPAVQSCEKLEQALRRRRKNFLGSDIPLKYLLEDNGLILDQDINLLAQYLAGQTLEFWNQKDADAERFCYQFYRLTMFALRYGNIRESVDDIIQMSGVLVRSKKVFQFAGEELLPPKMFGELYKFLDNAENAYLTPHFEDAVLFAISTLLGSLVALDHNTEREESEE